MSQICPHDSMHTTAEGALKMEAAAFLFYCIRVKKWFTLHRFNQVLCDYPWPPEQGRCQTQTATFLEGRRVEGVRGPFPKLGIHLHMTAGQKLHFTIHSIAIFSLILPTEASEDPAWRCWKLHVQINNMLVLHAFTPNMIQRLDQLIFQWHTAFLSIDTYRVWLLISPCRCATQVIHTE